MGLDIKKTSNFIMGCMNTIHTPSVGLSSIYIKKTPSCLYGLKANLGVCSD